MKSFIILLIVAFAGWFLFIRKKDENTTETADTFGTLKSGLLTGSLISSSTSSSSSGDSSSSSSGDSSSSSSGDSSSSSSGDSSSGGRDGRVTGTRDASGNSVVPSFTDYIKPKTAFV